jgi:hypothetical protein
MSEPLSINVSEVFTTWPTAKFRWYVRYRSSPNPCATLVGISTLQQWHQFSTGGGEWKDIEVVKETEDG